MTQGAAPRFSDDAYAQWVRRRMEALGITQKKQLAALLQEASAGRLGEAGSAQLVLRATSGHAISEANRDLIARVLGGPDPQDLAARLAALVEQGERLVELLPRLLSDARELRGEG